MAKPTAFEIQMADDLHSDGERLTNGERGNTELMGMTIGRLAKAFATLMKNGIMTTAECERMHSKLVSNSVPIEGKYIKFRDFKISGYALNDIIKGFIMLCFFYTMGLTSGLVPENMDLRYWFGTRSNQNAVTNDAYSEAIHEYLMQNSEKYAKHVKENRR